MKSPTNDQLLRDKALNDNFNYFSRHCLKIKDKAGVTRPFIMNRAQEYLHGRITLQTMCLGRVRILIVKGRQQGCSTYVGGRFYWRAIRHKGKNVFILSHLSDTTKKLFKMVKRFYDNTPIQCQPKHEINNGKEFEFKEIDSEYAVGTAGNEDVGRGGTVQLFHGSEVAFWEKTEGIQTGILQSIPDLDETEIILESTANGMGNAFYTMCMAALKNKNDYEVVFIPWFWQEEYRRDSPPDGNMELSPEEVEFKELYEITDQQVYWRRGKIAEFTGDTNDSAVGDWKFKQEYPSFLEEAFQTSNSSLINAHSIQKARKSTLKMDMGAPLIMGVDPARNGDRVIFSYRRGRTFLAHEEFSFDLDDEVQVKIAGLIAERINRLGVNKVFIDTGHGYGVRDILHSVGYRKIVHMVNFGSKALNEEAYANKRAEMWCLMRDFFHGEDGEVSIPDDDVIQADLNSMPEAETTTTNRIKFPLKKEIRKKFGMSPDIGDAMCLTFAFPVPRLDIGGWGQSNGFTKKKNKTSNLITQQRRNMYNKGHTTPPREWSRKG